MSILMLFERIYWDRQPKDSYENSHWRETIHLWYLQKLIHNKGSSTSSWVDTYRLETLRLHFQKLQQKIFKSWPLENTHETSCKLLSNFNSHRLGNGPLFVLMKSVRKLSGRKETFWLTWKHTVAQNLFFKTLNSVVIQI